MFIIFVLLIGGSLTSDVQYNISGHPAWKILDQFDCGESVSDRIIGGFNASLGQFPWIGLLGYAMPSDDNPGETEMEWLCGGALISARHVVTAAHCVTSEDYGRNLFSVRLGDWDVSRNPDCQKQVCAPPVQEIKIAKTIHHPNFNKPVFHHDIAILVLEKPANLNDYVVPVCLPREAEHLTIKEYDLVTIAGWGKVNMSTEERAEILQYLQVPILPSSSCGALFKAFKLGKDQICAGAQMNKDACGGDSGGPLTKVFDTREGPKTYLMGAVSFGPAICGIKKPGVYASIPFFLKWILDELIRS